MKKLFLFTTIIVFIILILGSIFLIEMLRKKNDYTQYIYEFEFVPENNNETFVIEIPILIPLTERDTIQGFENNFFTHLEVLNGSVEKMIINTSDYGNTLLIEGNTSLKIKCEFIGKFDQHKIYHFSTRESYYGFAQYNGNYWFNFNNTFGNASFTLSYHWGDSDFENYGLIEGNLNLNGWQLKEGYEENTVSSY